MSTLPAYFMLIAALILFYSAHLFCTLIIFLSLPLSYFCVITFSRCVCFHFVHFVHCFSCLVCTLFCLYYLIIPFTALLLAQFCSSLRVYHMLAVTSICSANRHSRIYDRYISGLPRIFCSLLPAYSRLASACSFRPCCLAFIFRRVHPHCCNCLLCLTCLFTTPSEYQSSSDQAHCHRLSLCPLLLSSFNNNNNTLSWHFAHLTVPGLLPFCQHLRLSSLSFLFGCDCCYRHLFQSSPP